MTKVHAKIRISYYEKLPIEFSEFFWTAVIFGVVCTKNWIGYKTGASARRAAIRWCERLGLTYTVTVDKDIRS